MRDLGFTVQFHSYWDKCQCPISCGSECEDDSGARTVPLLAFNAIHETQIDDFSNFIGLEFVLCGIALTFGFVI